MMLHVTNGDGAAELIRASEVEGEVLPWRDVLHEGPVPAGLPLRESSRVRAEYIADRGWGDLDDLLRQFEERDRVLLEVDSAQEIVLWFEHDLYDQLQMLQMGQLAPEQMASLLSDRKEVAPAQTQLARRAWSAFRDTDPTAVAELQVIDV